MAEFTIREDVDHTTRTHYPRPTFAQVEAEVADLVHRLGMYRTEDVQQREALAQAIADSLPYRITRRVMGLGPDLVAELALA